MGGGGSGIIKNAWEYFETSFTNTPPPGGSLKLMEIEIGLILVSEYWV